MSWEAAWQEGRTPWDAAESPPVLHEVLASGSLAPGRVLVPGCGTGYDVFTFAEAGFDAVGLDLAPTAAARFTEAREARGIDPDKARIEVGDFFAFAPSAPFDVFWDYTFLCAIDPSERPRWAESVERLLAPDGELITLLFPVVDVPPRGEGNPPFPLTPDHAKALLEPRWEPTTLAPVEKSHPGRHGKEWLGRWRRRAG